MFSTMTQRGAWWKGITDDGTEVAISDDFFKHIQSGQQKSREEHPKLTQRTVNIYRKDPACMSPQWWVDSFIRIADGIGLQEHTWVRKRNYIKLMLGKVTQHGYSSNEVGSEGTLIFRKLTKKQLDDWQRYWGILEDMQTYVEDFWADRGVTVRW